MEIKLQYKRRKTSNVQVGNIVIGSDFPIRVQTMANTSTNDIDGSVDQARRCIEAGAELLRFTTQGLREVESLKEIRKWSRRFVSTLATTARTPLSSESGSYTY